MTHLVFQCDIFRKWRVKTAIVWVQQLHWSGQFLTLQCSTEEGFSVSGLLSHGIAICWSLKSDPWLVNFSHLYHCKPKMWLFLPSKSNVGIDPLLDFLLASTCVDAYAISWALAGIFPGKHQENLEQISNSRVTCKCCFLNGWTVEIFKKSASMERAMGPSFSMLMSFLSKTTIDWTRTRAGDD